MTPIPELDGRSGSWVVSSPDGKRVYELYERKDVQIVANAGWKIETAGEYLGRINAEIRANQTPTLQ